MKPEIIYELIGDLPLYKEELGHSILTRNLAYPKIPTPNDANESNVRAAINEVNIPEAYYSVTIDRLTLTAQQMIIHQWMSRKENGCEF